MKLLLCAHFIIESLTGLMLGLQALHSTSFWSSQSSTGWCSPYAYDMFRTGKDVLTKSGG